MTAGYEGTSRIIGGTAIVPVDVDPGLDVDVPFRFIPDFPDLPMEEVYPREGPRDPAVVCRTTPSGGRVAYVAFNLGSVFWETLQRDHLQLVGNLVRWALGDLPRVEVTGDGLVDIAVRAGEQLTVVAVANIETRHRCAARFTTSGRSARRRSPSHVPTASGRFVPAVSSREPTCGYASSTSAPS